MRRATLPTRSRLERLAPARGLSAGPVRGLAVALLIAGLMCPLPARGAEWAAIVPGESTMESVRQRHGNPSRETALKIEGYDATSWVYEGDRAPRGVRRLTVEFGLLTAEGYRPRLVRLLLLEPAPGVFTRQTVLLGWGIPDRTGEDPNGPVFFYQAGLLVEFDKDGWLARRMTFTIPQPRLD